MHFYVTSIYYHQDVHIRDDNMQMYCTIDNKSEAVSHSATYSTNLLSASWGVVILVDKYLKSVRGSRREIISHMTISQSIVKLH